MLAAIIAGCARPPGRRHAHLKQRKWRHAHVEVIVVDDGPSDDTRNAIAAIDDERVRCVWQEYAGLVRTDIVSSQSPFGPDNIGGRPLVFCRGPGDEVSARQFTTTSEQRPQ